MSDPVFVNYKSLQLLSPARIGDGGQVLNANFTTVADFIDATNATIAELPTSDDVGRTIAAALNFRPNFDQVNDAISDALAGYITQEQSNEQLDEQVAYFLRKDQNLADLSDKATARSNLGLGSIATMQSGQFQVAGSYVTPTSLSTTLGGYSTTTATSSAITSAISALSLGTASTHAAGDFAAASALNS